MAYLDEDPAALEGNYLGRHWRGDLPLPKSYWVNGVIAGAIVSFAAPPFMNYLHEAIGSLQASAILWFVFVAFFLAFWVWTQVGIWRSAGRHKARGGSVGWAIAARIMVAVSTAGLLLQGRDLALQANEFGSLAFGYDPIGEDARIELSGDGRILEVAGYLTAGSADRFAAMLERSPALVSIALDSDGGRIFEGQRMAALIRARRLDTQVDDHCASACTFVLLAGRRRVAGPGAEIGFHQPSFPGMSTQDGVLMVADMRRLYREGGISDAFLDRVLNVPPEEMWYPSHDELIEAHVLTEAIPDEIVEVEEAAE